MRCVCMHDIIMCVLNVDAIIMCVFMCPYIKDPSLSVRTTSVLTSLQKDPHIFRSDTIMGNKKAGSDTKYWESLIAKCRTKRAAQH